MVFTAWPALRSEVVELNIWLNKNSNCVCQSWRQDNWPFPDSWEECERTPFIHCDNMFPNNTLSPRQLGPEVPQVIGLCVVKITVTTGEFFFHTLSSSVLPLLAECEPFPDGLLTPPCCLLWMELSGHCAFSYPVCFEIWFEFSLVKGEGQMAPPVCLWFHFYC